MFCLLLCLSEDLYTWQPTFCESLNTKYEDLNMAQFVTPKFKILINNNTDMLLVTIYSYVKQLSSNGWQIRIGAVTWFAFVLAAFNGSYRVT